MKLKIKTVKRIVTFIMTAVMISLFAVNAFAADTIRCKTYGCAGTEFDDVLEEDGMPTIIYLTPTITPDRNSSSGYRISSVDMSFEIRPYPRQSITSMSQIGIMFEVYIGYEFPNGYTGLVKYSKWVYYSIFPDQPGTFKSCNVTIDIPEYDNVNYRGTKYISAAVAFYTNSNASVSESGKFYTDFSIPSSEDIYMSQIVSDNT